MVEPTKAGISRSRSKTRNVTESEDMAAKSNRPNSSRRVLSGGKFGNLHDFEDFAVTKDFIAFCRQF